jgi:hypothetical protein
VIIGHTCRSVDRAAGGMSAGVSRPPSRYVNNISDAAHAGTFHDVPRAVERAIAPARCDRSPPRRASARCRQLRSCAPDA